MATQKTCKINRTLCQQIAMACVSDGFKFNCTLQQNFQRFSKNLSLALHAQDLSGSFIKCRNTLKRHFGEIRKRSKTFKQKLKGWSRFCAARTHSHLPVCSARERAPPQYVELDAASGECRSEKEKGEEEEEDNDDE